MRVFAEAQSSTMLCSWSPSLGVVGGWVGGLVDREKILCACLKGGWELGVRHDVPTTDSTERMLNRHVLSQPNDTCRRTLCAVVCLPPSFAKTFSTVAEYRRNNSQNRVDSIVILWLALFHLCRGAGSCLQFRYEKIAIRSRSS
jgi:hypothetical protein